MKIKVSSINFGAKFVSSEKVLKRKASEKTYETNVVSFVEIDPNNSNDIKSIYNATRGWFYDSYGCCILMTLRDIAENFVDQKKYKIFALTSQKNNYEELNPDKILGLSQMILTEGETPYLNYLQVNPDYIEQYDFLKNREYKGIGNGMLNALKKVYDSISLRAASSGLDSFYKKNSFSLVNKLDKKYFWKK